MNIEEVRFFCLSKKHVTESFPFDKDTLVFKVANKIFALIKLSTKPFAINLKCNPEKAIELREKFTEITAGYHMNKKHWNTVQFEHLSKKMVKQMITNSYLLVVKNLPKKQQEELKLL